MSSSGLKNRRYNNSGITNDIDMKLAPPSKLERGKYDDAKKILG